MWNKINSNSDLVEGVLRHGPEILSHCLTNDASQYLERVFKEKLNYPTPPNRVDIADWFIPNDYINFDIKQYCLDCCETDEEKARVAEEFEYFQNHNMVLVLKCMKFIVDTLRHNNIVWGVGRGSSVASFCLFLIGVHKVNSIKYQIPLEEFFK